MAFGVGCSLFNGRDCVSIEIGGSLEIQREREEEEEEEEEVFLHEGVI